MRQVLVVDTFAGLGSVLAVALEPHCRLEIATTALVAARHLGSAAPDLVIVNTSAPGLAGRTVIETVQARVPACRIVATEVSDAATLLSDLGASRIDCLLPVPLDVGDLLCATIAALSLEARWHMPSIRMGAQVSRALAYIAGHFREPVTVARIGRDIGVSASHLAHLFHDVTAIAVKEYVTRVRVDATRRALLATDLSLDVLAAEYGFCDASHLSRTFRRYTGQWPGHFRREAMRHEAETQSRPTSPHARSLSRAGRSADDGHADEPSRARLRRRSRS